MSTPSKTTAEVQRVQVTVVEPRGDARCSSARGVGKHVEAGAGYEPQALAQGHGIGDSAAHAGIERATLRRVAVQHQPRSEAHEAVVLPSEAVDRVAARVRARVTTRKYAGLREQTARERKAQRSERRRPRRSDTGREQGVSTARWDDR